MAVSVYFDGSGRADDPTTRHLTLAGFCGSDEPWEFLERRWVDILSQAKAREYKGQPYIHAREASRMDSEYGWTNERFQDVAFSLLDVVGQLDRESFMLISCSVIKEDFERAKPMLKNWVTSPATVCTEYGFSQIRIPDHVPDGSAIVSIWYDRNEEFMHHVDQAWRAMPQRKRSGWRLQTATVAAVEDMRLTPALQASDLAAWITNRHYSTGDYDNLWNALMMANTFPNQRHILFDYQAILSRFARVGLNHNI